MNINNTKFIVAMAIKRLSVSALAEKSGVGRVTISCIKNGKTKSVRPDTLGKLAYALGVDVTELLED